MNTKNLQDLDYDLELERVVKEIKKKKAKKVLIQLPDGLKPYATKIQEELENLLAKEKIKTDFLIWLDSCYGACDVPIAESKELGIDLIVQFGHTAWDYSKKKEIKIIKSS